VQGTAHAHSTVALFVSCALTITKFHFNDDRNVEGVSSSVRRAADILSADSLQTGSRPSQALEGTRTHLKYNVHPMTCHEGAEGE